MDVDEALPSTSGSEAHKDKDAAASSTATASDVKGGDGKEEKGDGKEGDKAKEPEPTSYSLSNPARVVPAQLKFVSLGGAGSRCVYHTWCMCVCPASIFCCSIAY